MFKWGGLFMIVVIHGTTTNFVGPIMSLGSSPPLLALEFA